MVGIGIVLLISNNLITNLPTHKEQILLHLEVYLRVSDLLAETGIKYISKLGQIINQFSFRIYILYLRSLIKYYFDSETHIVEGKLYRTRSMCLK